MSKMSHDRVHFTVPNPYLKLVEIRDCLEETLGVDTALMSTLAGQGKDINLVCRPSQFARFIILRHVKYREPNNMACLNMRLVVPEPSPPVVDASTNPNKVTEGAP